MTVCIAGISVVDGPPTIIFCSDTRLSIPEFSSSNTRNKIENISERAAVIRWGDDSRASELINLARHYLSSAQLTEDNFVSHFRRIAKIQKRRLVDEYFSTRWSISRKEFIGGALSHLPERDRSVIAEEVKQIGLGAGLIVGLFIDETPFLLEIVEDGSVLQHDAFVVEGSGRTVALANMLYRRFTPVLSLEQATYIIYESKVLSEAEPHVGEGTSIYTLSNDTGDILNLMELATLHYQFEQLCPRPIPERLETLQPSPTEQERLLAEIMRRNEVTYDPNATENDSRAASG